MASAATPPYVRSVRGGFWHIASHVPSGYGVWTLCGRSWPESNYMIRTKGGAALCKSCRKIEEARRAAR